MDTHKHKVKKIYQFKKILFDFLKVLKSIKILLTIKTTIVRYKYLSDHFHPQAEKGLNCIPKVKTENFETINKHYNKLNSYFPFRSATISTQLWDLLAPLKSNLFVHKLHRNQKKFSIASSIRGVMI